MCGWMLSWPVCQQKVGNMLVNRQFAAFGGLQMTLEWLNHPFGQTIACSVIGSYIYMLKPFIFKKSANSSLWNCGPLSLTQWTGNPYFANKSHKMAIVAVADVFRGMKKISGQREWASTTDNEIMTVFVFSVIYMNSVSGVTCTWP